MLAGGCASAPKPARDGVTPPKLLSGLRPDLRFPRLGPGRAVDIRVEVQIDANGRPDVETLRITGDGAAENRDVITRWLQTSSFQPAQRDGRSVPGTFRTGFRVEVRRL